MTAPKSMLFSLDGKDFMESYSKLESAYTYWQGTAKTLARWSDTEGGGKFTNLISLDFISYLKQAIASGKYKANVPYNEQYGRMKFAKDPREWFLFGNVINSISIIYRGRHTQTVGIRRSMLVPRIGIDGKRYGSISIARYAMINEFGLDEHPARPIFQPAMRDFIAENFPPMVKAFKKAMINAADKEAKRIMAFAGTKSSAKGDIGNVLSQASLGDFTAVSNKNINRDFSADIYQEGLSTSSREMSTKELNKSGSRISKDVDREMVKMAKSMGMSIDELNEFLSNG